MKVRFKNLNDRGVVMKKCDKCGVRNKSVVSRYDVNLCTECANELAGEYKYERGNK